MKVGQLLLTALVFLLATQSVAAEDSTTVSVSPTEQTVSAGESFTVEVVVNPKSEIAGVQFDLRFDPSLLTVENVEEGDLLSQGGASTYFQSDTVDSANGVLKDVAGSITTPGSSVSSSGTFARIDILAKDVNSEGASLLDLENVVVGDPDSNPVPISIVDGNVEVLVYPDWDMNADGHVNVLDMIGVGQHFGEGGSPHWIRQDANRDGTVDVLDMIFIGQHWTG